MRSHLAQRILREHRPEQDAILVILPCSSRKPYDKSRTQSLYRRALLRAVNGRASDIEVASLSGLHGIVPDAFAQSREVLRYNANLNRSSSLRAVGMTPGQAREHATKMASRFLVRYGPAYSAVVGFGRENYRRVLAVLKDGKFPRLIVLPSCGQRLSTGGLDELCAVVHGLCQSG